MRSLLILIDGLGDEPIAEWQGQTPFQHSHHPVMDALEKQGTLAQVSICENDIVPESCSCILRLLGVAKQDMPGNRAYLELLAHDRDISEYEMVLRCNLVAVDEEGRLTAFNGQGLSPEEMRSAADACNDILKDIEFLHLSEYRNLLIMNKEQSVLELPIAPPHESVGENYSDLVGGLCKTSLSVSYLLQEAHKRLLPFAKNGVHYELYPWGASERTILPSFEELHGFKGAAVCKAEIVKGIGRALGMEVAVPAGATGDVDTDIHAKAESTLNLLQEKDFVLAHFNGSDEAAHRYDYKEKSAFIEQIDSLFIDYIVKNYSQPLKIIICGDHVTSSVTGKHGRGTTPVVAAAINCKKQAGPIENYHHILDFLMKESECNG